MKKTLLLPILLIQCGLLMAQMQTAVTINGKKITFPNLSSIDVANNGLTLSPALSVQLGGTLTRPSILTTTSIFTLAIEGLTSMGTVNFITDNLITTDATGNLKMISPMAFQNEPWYNAADNTQATLNSQNIYQMGNVGIGTQTPTRRLEVYKGGTAGSAVKIDDGSQATNYVLTSDANGLATWKPSIPKAGFANGILPQTQVDLDHTVAGSIIYFGSNIDLPPGKWAVYLGMVLNPKTGLTKAEINSNYVARFTLSDMTDAISSTSFSFLTSNKFYLNMVSTGVTTTPYALMILGCVRVEVASQPQETTRLYLLSTAQGKAIGSVKNNTAENYFYAIRIE